MKDTPVTSLLTCWWSTDFGGGTHRYPQGLKHSCVTGVTVQLRPISLNLLQAYTKRTSLSIEMGGGDAGMLLDKIFLKQKTY